MTMLMSMDFNHWVEILNETLKKSKSKIVQENAFALGMGANLLIEYLKRIAQHAIDTNNTELIDLCKGLCVIKETRSEK